MRRTALGAATALLTALGLTTAAPAAGPTTVEVDSHVTPVIRAFKPDATPATLAINLDFQGPDGEQPATVKRVLLKFTYGARLMGKLFPSCSADRIRNHRQCPKGSVIGSGKGLGMVGGPPSPALENIDLTLYNGPRGKSITFRIQGKQPAVIDVPFDAPLKTFSGGTYNYQVDATVPEILQRVAGLPVSLDYLNLKVGATRRLKGRRVGYIETLICPPKALVPLQGDFEFLESDPFHIDTYIRCGT